MGEHALKRKYNIAARLEMLNRKNHEAVIKRLLEELKPTSRSSLYRWMNTQETDRFEIRYSYQQKIAAVFGCDVDDLINKQRTTLNDKQIKTQV